MATKPRYAVLADHSFFHVMWQCHNQNWLLKDDWAKQFYYDLLLRYKNRYGLVFYSYHFMENHVHLTGRVGRLERFSNFFRLVNNLFSRNLNRRLLRSGQAIMDRFLSPPIRDDRQMLAVLAYIDLNGVRAGRDTHPRESRWSSYRFYAHGRGDSLLEHVPNYLALADSEKQRQKVYRQIVEAQMHLYPTPDCSV